MGTMDAMQKVMSNLANIMGSAKNKIKVEDFIKTAKTYTTEKEKMEALNELVQDTMDIDDDGIDDSDADKLILSMEDEAKRKRLEQAQQDEEEEAV
jgi:urease gamma subunit